MKIELPPGFPIGFQPVVPLVIDIPENKDEAGEINKPIESESQQDTIHNESRARSMQSELKLSGNLQASQLNSQLGIMGVGSSGPQVKELQNQLNEWRATQGKPPIGADGIYGKQTEAAVKDFQQSVGLKQDGLAGPDVKRYMGAAKNLSQDSNYQQVSNQTKNLAVISLAKNPNDPAHLENVKGMVKDMNGLEQDSGFQHLPDSTQQGVRNLMYQYADHPVGRQFVSDLAKNERFQNLTPAQQEKALGTVMSNSTQDIGERYPYYMNWILNSKALDGPKDDQLTNAVLNTTDRVAGNAGNLFGLHEMLNDPKFVNASRDDQLAMLNGYAGKSGVEIPA